jgi:hypothetical protein
MIGRSTLIVLHGSWWRGAEKTPRKQSKVFIFKRLLALLIIFLVGKTYGMAKESSARSIGTFSWNISVIFRLLQNRLSKR